MIAESSATRGSSNPLTDFYKVLLCLIANIGKRMHRVGYTIALPETKHFRRILRGLEDLKEPSPRPLRTK